MGCFPNCFSHWRRHKQTKKNVQQQCLSPPIDESAKLLLPATVKEEDPLMNPINLVPDSDNDLNNDDKLERIEEKSSFLINDEEKEESCDSLFSLSIDSRKQVCAVDMEDKEVNSRPLLPVLGASLKCDEDKENVSLSKDPIIKQIAVDTTSLSSWLVASNMDNSSPRSENNYGVREILGAITFNGILSGGSTPCGSADDQLGIGTVGGYWRRTWEPQRFVD